LLDTFREQPGPFFFECAPVDTASFESKAFEFAIVPAPALAGVLPDPATFTFPKTDEPAVAFPNLGGDALLVSPLPRQDASYASLYQFVRNAPRADALALLALAARTFATELAAAGGRPRWLSTSGLGVSWLHVRIDQRPKYLKTLRYNSWPQVGSDAEAERTMEQIRPCPLAEPVAA
jgi:hypothetical protein